MSLLSFNLGVEAGQLMILMVLVPIVNLFFRYVLRERIGTIVISVFVAHTAWHWMAERYTAWRAYDVRWADLFDAVVLGELRWLVVVLVAGVSVSLWLRKAITSSDTHAGTA